MNGLTAGTHWTHDWFAAYDTVDCVNCGTRTYSDEAKRRCPKMCPHGDPHCPCPDGDPCHYQGPNPMRSIIGDLDCGFQERFEQHGHTPRYVKLATGVNTSTVLECGRCNQQAHIWYTSPEGGWFLADTRLDQECRP